MGTPPMFVLVWVTVSRSLGTVTLRTVVECISMLLVAVTLLARAQPVFRWLAL